MKNHILPLLDVGVSDRFAASQKKSNIAEDKGFAKTFQDIEQKVSYADRKESTASARESSAAREEPSAARNESSTARKESSVAKDSSVRNEPSAEKESSVKEESSIAKESSGSASTKAEESNKTESTSVKDDADSTDSNTPQVTSSDTNTNKGDGFSIKTQSGEVSSTLLSTTDTEVIDALDLQPLLDTILEKLQAIKEQGGTEALESALDPEALQELVDELFVNGNELPLAPVIASIQDALSASSGVTLGAAANLLSDLQKISPLKPLAEALTTKLSSQIQLSAPLNSTIIANDSVAIESDLLLSQPNKLVATGDALAQIDLQKFNIDQTFNAIIKEESGAVTSRLSSELAGTQPLQTTQSLQPGMKAQLAVSTPFQQAQWGKDVAERVMWMSSQGIQEAEIHLDPPELGPLQVRVSVVNEQAHVSFVVQHSTVREALDQNAMRLREMFDGEGINLADVDVSDQSQEQGDSNPDDNASANLTAGLAGEDVDQGETPIFVNKDGYSILNLYA